MTFKVKGVVEDAPMAETLTGPGNLLRRVPQGRGQDRGYYVGAYRLKETDRAKDREMEFSFKHPVFGKASLVRAS